MSNPLDPNISSREIGVRARRSVTWSLHPGVTDGGRCCRPGGFFALKEQPLFFPQPYSEAPAHSWQRPNLWYAKEACDCVTHKAEGHGNSSRITTPPSTARMLSVQPEALNSRMMHILKHDLLALPEREGPTAHVLLTVA